MDLVSSDAHSGFAPVEWPNAQDACMRVAPSLAPAFAAMWVPGSVNIHVETERNQSTPIPVYGSLLQGGQDGHSVVCLVSAACVWSRLVLWLATD